MDSWKISVNSLSLPLVTKWREKTRKNDTHCHIGVLKIKLIFEDTCVEKKQDPAAFTITLDLWSFMFQNNFYYLYTPLDIGAFYPVLSYHRSTVTGKAVEKDSSVVKVCENTDMHVDWHTSNMPVSGYRDNMQCGLTDIGGGRYVLSFNEAVKVTTVQISFDDLYQYDADGNLVATDQLDFMMRMEREQIHERIVLEKDYYYII